jgi:[glutamine synthetase] adenylyltransferase / [glutamine synthetase]-adenylyl-L-tyrosine phosphorylase
VVSPETIQAGSSRRQASLARTLMELCPDVGTATVHDFVTRLDRDYFTHFGPDEICRHMAMAEALAEGDPVQVELTPHDDERLGIVVVAHDYFSEFSVLCGLLASFGLDIHSGHSYTFSKPAKPKPPQDPARRPRRSRAEVSPTKIVDAFEVRVLAGETFSGPEQAELLRELRYLASLLAAGDLDKARERLNERLIGRLSQTRGGFAGRIDPIKVRFSNGVSKRWTVMDVYTRDTPGFLYAFSNALSLRGIYIHRVRIESHGDEVRDRFYISDRQGRRIADRHDRAVLAKAVVLIEQFTHFLPRAPDPGRAIRYFDQFLDKVLERDPAGSRFRIVEEREGLDLLAQLLGSSEFLWEELLRSDFEHLMPVLEGLTRGRPHRDQDHLRASLRRRIAAAPDFESRKSALNAFKDSEMFRIDLEWLRAPGDLAGFTHALSDLAEVVLQEAKALVEAKLEAAYGRPRNEQGGECRFAICALGKLGGREIGYASDIELVLVYDGAGLTSGPKAIGNDAYFDRLVKELCALVEARREGVFHIDLRLRPHGKAGPLASPFPLWRDYYADQGGAAPFERQALIKLRFIAGSEALGRLVEAERDRIVYDGRPWDQEQALHLRRRQVRELVPPGRVNVKYSSGGLLDVEYAVQYLQIQHGHEHPQLRTPATLAALEALAQAGFLSRRAFARLRTAYLFLRRLIEAMRMVKGDARDLVLPDLGSPQFAFLARRMGYRERDFGSGSERLARHIRLEMTAVQELFSSRFGEIRPEGAAGS